MGILILEASWRTEVCMSITITIKDPVGLWRLVSIVTSSVLYFCLHLPSSCHINQRTHRRSHSLDSHRRIHPTRYSSLTYSQHSFAASIIPEFLARHSFGDRSYYAEYSSSFSPTAHIVNGGFIHDRRRHLAWEPPSCFRKGHSQDEILPIVALRMAQFRREPWFRETSRFHL